MNVTSQTKFTKDEWNSIEIPVQPDEMRILTFIQKAFHTPDLVENQMLSLYSYLKVDSSPELDVYLCNTYFSIQKVDIKVKLKKADQIRVASFTKKISVILYEHVLIDLCEKKEYFHSLLFWPSERGRCLPQAPGQSPPARMDS